MSEPLYVHPDDVRSYAQIHDEVVAGLSQLIGAAAPEAAGVQTSHGAIASAVSAALSGVLGTREGTLQATGTSGSTISELLQKAAQMYEHGDQKGAATLRAAAEALEGQGRVHRDRLGLLPTRPGRQAPARQVRAAATRWARSSARWDSRPDSSARWPSR